MTLLFSVPPFDKEEFHALDFDEQAAIYCMLRVMKRVHNAPRKQRVKQLEIESVAFRGKKGKSWRTLRTKYYKYRNTGDWHDLQNKAKAKNGKIPLNADFVQFFQGLCDNHKRSTNSAIDELRSRWYAGDEIPGYGTWREWWAKQDVYKSLPLPAECPEDFPEGWSRSNLNSKKYKPCKTQRLLVTKGIAAALFTMPTCISTREGMRPFEYLAFDDAETDFSIVHHETAQVCKLEGLFGKDVATDCWLRFGLRPGIKMPDGRRDSLKRQDMLELAVQILTTYGYPRDYISYWIVERGTANINEADAAAIYDATDGHVVISPTGMIAGKVLCEGYADKAVGNFKAKPWIESGFSLLWNKLDHVRGQKGDRYQNKPMEIETRTKAAVDILKAGKLLPPEVMLQENLPFQDLRESFHSVNDALKLINNRTEHRCEGFQRVTKWRFQDFGIKDWQAYKKLLKLPSEVRDQVEVRKFMESPYDRMDRLNKEYGVVMETIHPAAACRILNDYHRKVKVLDGEICVTIDGQKLRYFDVDSPLCGAEGAEYLAYLPKGDYDVIYLTTGIPAGKTVEKRKYLGSLPRRIGGKYGDLDARNKHLADKRKALARHTRAVRKRHGEDIEKAIEATDQTMVLMQRLDAGLLEQGAAVGGSAPAVVTHITGDIADRRSAFDEEDAQKARDTDLAQLARNALMANAK